MQCFCLKHRNGALRGIKFPHTAENSIVQSQTFSHMMKGMNVTRLVMYRMDFANDLLFFLPEYYVACSTYRYPEKLLHYVTIVENKSKIFAGDDEKRNGDHNQVPGG